MEQFCYKPVAMGYLRNIRERERERMIKQSWKRLSNGREMPTNGGTPDTLLSEQNLIA